MSKFKTRHLNNSVKQGFIDDRNRIRIDFPDVFARRARQEREIGKSCINGVYLDELDPRRGNMRDEPMGECSLLCAAVEDDLK